MTKQHHRVNRHGINSDAEKCTPSRRRKTVRHSFFLCRFDTGHFSASGFNPWLLLLLFLFLASPPAHAAPSPEQQIRASYARLDAAYSQRNVPAIMAFLAPDFKRVKWNASLTPMQFQAELKDDFDGTASAAANTRLKSLAIHGDTANAVVFRRINWTYPKPSLLLLPPYFSVKVTQEEWRNTQEQWRLTNMADTPLVQTLSLLDMRDQGIRNRYFAGRKNRAVIAQMGQVDAADRARLKQIIRQCGWPGFDLAGTDGEGFAFEVVQHSDAERAFQKRCLSLIKAAVTQGQAMPNDAAYLIDRICTGEHKPQVYGTQWNVPIADAAHVDKRRASVGLGPLAVYEAPLKQMYQPQTKP